MLFASSTTVRVALARQERRPLRSCQCYLENHGDQTVQVDLGEQAVRD